MKIAYVAVWPIPSQVANSVHVMKMCQALARCNHNVTLFCPQAELVSDNIFEQYGVEDNFCFSPVKKRKGRMGLINYAIKVSLRAKKLKADLLYSRCLMSAWMATRFGLPVLFEQHDSFDNQGFFAKAVFKSLIKNKNLKGLVVISQALKDHIKKRFNIPDDRIIVAHDGADPLPEATTVPPFNKKENSFHVGYIGHLYKGRGIDIIAETARKLTDIEFHIVGGTNEDLCFWKEELKDLRNIHFYGHIPHSQTPSFLKHFDVLLAPYQKKVGGYGGSGNTVQWMSPLKIFEYMSTGTPVISSDLPVLHEILEDRRNAFLCTPDAPEDWIKTIKYIRAHPEEAQCIANAAQTEFLSQYTWQKRAEYITGELKIKAFPTSTRNAINRAL